MLTALRASVQARLARVPTWRKPALRRSDDPEALLATDLPLAADAGAVAQFMAALAAEGWLIRRDKGWLLLDHAVPVPDAALPEELSGEAGCCLSLLLRHPEGEAPSKLIRALIKAAEKGPEAVERFCAEWHGELAQGLREHTPLPGKMIPYLCAAVLCDTHGGG